MSAQTVRSVPTGIVLFLAGLSVFALAGATLEDLGSKRLYSRLHGEKLTVSSADWTPDGEFRYFGYRGPGNSTWSYGESLGQPVKQDAKSQEESRNYPRVWRCPLGETGERQMIQKDIHLLLQRDVDMEDAALLWWNGLTGHVEVYDHRTGDRLASLGSRGDVAAAPGRPADRLNARYVIRDAYGGGWHHSAYLVTAHCILAVPNRLEALKTVFRAPGKSEIDELGLGTIWGSARSQGASRRSWFLVRCTDRLYQVSDTGNQVDPVPFPDEIREKCFSVRPLKHGLHAFSIWDEGYRGPDYESLLVDQQGKILRRVNVDIAEINKRLHGDLSVPIDSLTQCILPPVPGLMSLLGLLQSTTIVLLLAGTVTWHQRTTGQSGRKRWLWPLFVFASSVFGFLCYWAIHWDDVTEACPKCRKKRLVGRDLCPHCQADWPKWKPLGVEIFDRRAT